MDDAAAVELLTRAVATSSVSGEEAAVAGLLVEAMASVGMEAHVDAAGNAVGVVGSGPVEVMFLGHIDTVPGTIPVRRDGDRLYGRGTVDAKGPFCAAIAAASRLGPDALAAIRLTLVGAVEEEAPSSKGARHVVASLSRPDLLIVGEPSGWSSVTLGYKGRLVVRLEAVVGNAHSAGSEPTAAELMVDAWQAIRDWARDASPDAAGIFAAVQATLQAVESDTDGLAQVARATVGLRLPPAWPPARAAAALRDLPRDRAVRVEFGGSEEPYRGPRDTPLTRAFRVAVRSAGGRPRTNVKTGTSDMNVVAPVWDVPMLAYGPGDSTLDHTPDEHIEVSEFTRAVGVLTTALETVAGTPSGSTNYSPDKS